MWSAFQAAFPYWTAKRELNNCNLGKVTFILGRGTTSFVLLGVGRHKAFHFSSGGERMQRHRTKLPRHLQIRVSLLLLSRCYTLSSVCHTLSSVEFLVA